MTARDRERKQQADQLYEQYGRVLEVEHQGDYVAIVPGGKLVVGPVLKDVLEKARASLGPGSFVFKIGERAVWRWR